MEIKDIVKEYFDSSAFDQSTRKREVVTERQINHFLYTSLTSLSIIEIGVLFRPPNKEGMNHATIINSIKAVQGHYKFEKDYRRKFNILISRLVAAGYNENTIIHSLNNPHGSGRKHKRTRFIPKSRGSKRVRFGQERKFVISGTDTEVRFGESSSTD